MKEKGVLLGVLVILATVCGSLAQQIPNPSPLPESTDSTASLSLDASDLASLDRSHQAYLDAAERLSVMYADLGMKVDNVAKVASTPGTIDPKAQDNLQSAINEMQQLRTRFHDEYLKVRQAMQDENRQYGAMSKILKSKHDTADNSFTPFAGTSR